MLSRLSAVFEFCQCFIFIRLWYKFEKTLCFFSFYNSVTSFIRCEVVLPCIYSERLSESVNTFWRDKDDKVVLDINSREDKMDPKLTGHVFSFPDQYKTGNLSIIIKDLRADAAGQYECDIPKVSLSKGRVNVTVAECTKAPSSHSPQARGRPGIIAFLILLLTVIATLCGVVWIRTNQKHKTLDGKKRSIV
uniref:Ig-like domain-containing protein n=1 Tax=Maylandia zebra TaxID=106582 RepID=A0A3P9D9W7_9CICH